MPVSVLFLPTRRGAVLQNNVRKHMNLSHTGLGKPAARVGVLHENQLRPMPRQAGKGVQIPTPNLTPAPCKFVRGSFPTNGGGESPGHPNAAADGTQYKTLTNKRSHGSKPHVCY